MAGRPSQRIRSKYAPEELNILPVMNVFMILVPFLLLSSAFVQLTIVDTSLPARAKSSTTAEETPPENKPKLNLTVFVTNDGLLLAGYGGVLEVQGETPAGQSEPASNRFKIDMKEVAGGAKEYDWDAFRDNLKKVKEAFPQHYSIIILPDNEVKYSVIIKLMDVSREYVTKKDDGTTERQWLFPTPILAWSVT